MDDRDPRRRVRGVGLGVAVLLAVCAPGALTAQPSSSVLPTSIPLFPLQDVMLFPGVPRPLHIFEPRYREMLLYALAGDRVIGMVMLQPGHEREYYGHPPVYDVGCAGVIANVEELPDGRYNVVLQGLTKFRVKSEDTSYAYRVAEVETIPETLSDEQQEALRGLRPRLLELLSTVVPDDQEPTPDEIPDDELINGLAQYLPMEPRDRLDLLESSDPLARARALIELLERRTPPP